jgi:hypothetical protein
MWFSYYLHMKGWREFQRLRKMPVVGCGLLKIRGTEITIMNIHYDNIIRTYSVQQVLCQEWVKLHLHFHYICRAWCLVKRQTQFYFFFELRKSVTVAYKPGRKQRNGGHCTQKDLIWNILQRVKSLHKFSYWTGREERMWKSKALKLTKCRWQI